MAVSKARKAEKPESIGLASQPTDLQKEVTCVISKDTVIEGTFGADQDVRLDGVVKGDVKCGKRLVMGNTGKIEGTLLAKGAVIMGTVQGEVNIDGTLHLKSSAEIHGNIQAHSMIVDEGAKYNGQCRVGKPTAA